MKTKKLKELTPKGFKCGIGPCPAIFKADNKFVIVGKVIDDETRQELKGRIGKDETAIEVPKNLLLNLKH